MLKMNEGKYRVTRFARDNKINHLTSDFARDNKINPLTSEV